jgi:ABC-type multidrug transport system fused ATPase/permease subunit
MADPIEIADVKEPKSASDRFNNRIALTIALLATAIAIFTIKAGNVNEAMMQAQAERNNGWAWYQAVRTREDMATYELSHLQRLRRTTPLESPEAARLTGEVSSQEGELARIRERLEETSARAEGAEAEYARLNALSDQLDLSEALLAVAITLLAVATLAQVYWLYWFALIPGLAGMALGVLAMANHALPIGMLTAWMG